jgi:hypothetical protein
MIQYADKTIVVNKEKHETSCEAAPDPKAALDTLSRSGISRWVHPVLYHPLDPLIIVEGKYDVIFFTEALKIIRPIRNIFVYDLQQLTADGTTGGDSEIERYVRAHASTIQARRTDAPIIVVLDWDSAKKVDTIRRLLPTRAAFDVLAWPDRLCNPRLNNTFRGIERYYSDRLISLAEQQGATIYRSSSGECSVARDEYNSKVKKILSEEVKKGLSEEDLIHSKEFLLQVLRSACALPATRTATS